MRQGIPPVHGRFGLMPGLKDDDAALSAEKEREPVLRGTSDDEGNPTPPGDVGTGQVGLGPAEPWAEKVEE